MRNEKLKKKQINSLPHNFRLVQLKPFADDTLSLTEKYKFVFGRVETSAGKGEN